MKQAKSRQEIAEEYGISPRTLLRWLQKAELDLPTGLVSPKYPDGADVTIYKSQEIPEKVYSDGQQTIDFDQSGRLANWIRESFAMRKGFDLL